MNETQAMSWLTALAAASLLILSAVTAVIRGQATAEGYVLARCEADTRSVDRRLHAVNTELQVVFATLGAPTVDPDAALRPQQETGR